MGMNPRGRSRGRGHNNFNNNRRFNNGPNRNTVYDSIGPAGRLRGTAFQLMEKYLSAAKEQMSSDRVLAESCLQHADHYMRLNALAVAAEGARFAQQSQPETESADTLPEVEPVENAAAEALPAAGAVENEPVVVSFVPVAAEPAGKTAEMDLSVPVAVMVENEIKARRGRPPMKKKPVQDADAVVPVKRRGRPPMKKTVEAGA